MTTIKLNVCANDEVLGVDGVNFQDGVDAAQEGRDFLMVECRRDFKYWNGGAGYGHGHVAVEIIGYGTVKTEADAKKAVAWLAGEGKDFPSSAEIEAAFEAEEALEDAISEAITKAEAEAANG